MSARASLLASGVLTLTACTGGIAPIAPVTLPPLSRTVAEGWIAELASKRPVRYDLRWHLDTKQGNAAGRAVVRIAPPDTMRFDYRGPFGRSGAAVILGDSVLWARPQADIVPAAPLFWVALGNPEVPSQDAELTGEERGSRRIWRVVRGRESLDIVHERGEHPRLLAQWHKDGVLIGACEVALNGRFPDHAELTFPETPSQKASRFTFSVESLDTLAQHDRAIWSAPR